jgi:hypothetical protein
MTETEAKELIISQMNYLAYKEFGPSLFVSDRNRLFGSDHYQLESNTVPSDTVSPWGPGQELEVKMPDLLRLAWLTSDKSIFRIAIDLVKRGDGVLAELIQAAEKDFR